MLLSTPFKKQDRIYLQEKIYENLHETIVNIPPHPPLLLTNLLPLEQMGNCFSNIFDVCVCERERAGDEECKCKCKCAENISLPVSKN